MLFDVVVALEEEQHLSPLSKEQPFSQTPGWNLEESMLPFRIPPGPQGMCKSSVGVIFWVSCFSVIWATFATGQNVTVCPEAHFP